MLTLEFQELKVRHNAHSIVVIEDYNIYQQRQWHNQVQEWDQMVVVHEAAICLVHGQVEQDQVHNHTAVVAVDLQGLEGQYTLYTTRINYGF
jgi:hypothetical protein